MKNKEPVVLPKLSPSNFYSSTNPDGKLLLDLVDEYVPSREDNIRVQKALADELDCFTHALVDYEDTLSSKKQCKLWNIVRNKLL